MESFAELYELHFSEIYRFVYWRVRDQVAAEDVTADVFARALKNFDKYEDRGRPFSCWLYRIAVNQLNDYFGARQDWLDLGEVREVQSDKEDLVETVVRRDEARNVWDAVDRLPTGQRTAIYLRYAQDLPLSHIAAAMGRSEAAIKLLIHRAVSRLRLELQPLAA
jgi:RNA polymerase sigma-70 factor (ECF subfamily)